MRRFTILLALTPLLILAFSACQNEKTYADQMEDQRNSIKEFMADQQIVVVETVPTVVPWPDGVYYKTSSGFYVHVIDTGLFVNKNIPKNTLYTLRFIEMDMEGDTTLNTFESSHQPVEINYNNVNTSSYNYDCEAWHEALDYVGDQGVIEMIVPAAMGWKIYTTTSTLTARYYKIKYKLWD
jgi:hypothetical protein